MCSTSSAHGTEGRWRRTEVIDCAGVRLHETQPGSGSLSESESESREKDRLLRASQAIALKTVAGQGPRVTAKRRTGDRRRHVEIARRSALACAAIQDVLPVSGAMSADDNRKQKAPLDRSVAMLAKRGQRGDAIREALGKYGGGQFDTDTDTD